MTTSHLKSLNTKKANKYGMGNPLCGFRQARKCGRAKHFQWDPNPPPLDYWNWISNNNTDNIDSLPLQKKSQTL